MQKLKKIIPCHSFKMEQIIGQRNQYYRYMMMKNKKPKT